MRTFNALRATAFLLFILGILSRSSAAQSSQEEHAARITAADALVMFSTEITETALDCSHFVNAVFEQVGLYYEYEPARVLYRGTTAFRRVYRPVSGDLIVWPGHVGIVVDPDEKTFVSALRRGVKVASYTSSYWRRRGRARFFRYRLPVTDPAWGWQASLLESSQADVRSGLQ